MSIVHEEADKCFPTIFTNKSVLFQIISLARDIGMANTTYIDRNGSYESHPDMSQPYILMNDTLVEFDIFQIRKIHFGVGTGGILSTSNDMARYMNFHLNYGRVGDRQIVPAV